MNRENKKAKHSKIRIFNSIITILLIAGIVFLVVIVLQNFVKKDNGKTEEKVVDEITTFNYTVGENDTKLFKDTFNDLKKVLKEKEVDNEKYAEIMSKLFVIDFFSLNNKTSKNDIGGVQFVYSGYKTDFVEYARNCIYKQVSNNLDRKKDQKLPLVDSVEVSSITKVSPSSIFKREELASDTEEDAYEVNISWTYKNDDDFQTSSTLTIVKDGSNLSVAKMTDR